MNKILKNASVPYEVSAIPSKSCAHRILICSALSDKPTTIECSDINEDIEKTAQVLRALGAVINYENGCFYVEPLRKLPEDTVILDCGASGSTLRFVLPIAAALNIKVRFTGIERLFARPMGPLIDCLQKNGAKIKSDSKGITVTGKLEPGTYSIPGDISSQYITGLMFALPLLNGRSRIELTTALESAPYVDLTLKILSEFGINITDSGSGYEVEERKYQTPGNVITEGDWSNAAFFLVSGVIGKHEVTVSGLSKYSVQGDRRIEDLLTAFGASLRWNGPSLTCYPSKLRGIEIDASDIPDLVPVLAVCASCADGVTVIKNIGRLRYKESDRVESVCRLLTVLGAHIEANDNVMTIYGGAPLHGGIVDGFGDHRIIMSAALASLVCDSPVEIVGAEAVSKSYPRFFEILQ